MRTTSIVMPYSSSTLVKSSWVSGRGGDGARRVADRNALGPSDGDPQLAEGGVRLLQHHYGVGGGQEQHHVDEEHLRHVRRAVHRSCIGIGVRQLGLELVDEHRPVVVRSFGAGPGRLLLGRGRPGLELVDEYRPVVGRSFRAGPGRLPDGLEGPAVGFRPRWLFAEPFRLAVGGERVEGVFFRAHGAHRLTDLRISTLTTSPTVAKNTIMAEPP